MSLDTVERARRAAQARWAGTPREQRMATTLPGRVAMAVKLLADNAPELTQAQKNKLRVILTQAPSGGGRDG